MKVAITMKDPDTLHDAVREAATQEVAAIAGLAEDEREGVVEERIEKALKVCEKWFEWGELLTVVVDTEARTISVEVKR